MMNPENNLHVAVAQSQSLPIPAATISPMNAAVTLSVHPKKNGANGSNNWCGCPGTVNNANENHTSCPVCLAKFDSDSKIPMGLPCGHTICFKCTARLYPSNGRGQSHAIPNVALLTFLECPVVPLPPMLEPDCLVSIFRLRDIALIIKSHIVSRAIHRKVMNLITSLVWNGQTRICRAARGVGERVLIELVTSCSHLSHYHAQQQLWAAIRARACQFMGPAMQEEALKLVLLALEDGSPLSRKVLVMFVVQRLAPQFPQASKTSIGHVIQLLYRASCFDVLKRPETSSLMTLRPEFRNYEALRKEHDAQIVKIALESGIRFSPEQWSSILYGDSSHKPHMQSIIDKLLAPQSFAQMTTEFLVNIQRLTDVDDANFLYSLLPHFQTLAAIELSTDSPAPTWKVVHETLEATHCVLVGLVSFNPKTKSTSNSNHYYQVPSRLPPTTAESRIPPRQFQRKPQISQGHPQVARSSSYHNSTPMPMPAINGFRTPAPTGLGQQFLDPPSGEDGNQINELLAESRLLRAKMKQLQDLMPSSAVTLQQEVAGLEEDATRMVQKINIH